MDTLENKLHPVTRFLVQDVPDNDLADNDWTARLKILFNVSNSAILYWIMN